MTKEEIAIIIICTFIIGLICVSIWGYFYNRYHKVNIVEAKFLSKSSSFLYNYTYTIKIYTKNRVIIVKDVNHKGDYIPYTSLEELNKDWKIVY